MIIIVPLLHCILLNDDTRRIVAEEVSENNVIYRRKPQTVMATSSSVTTRDRRNRFYAPLKEGRGKVRKEDCYRRVIQICKTNLSIIELGWV